MGYLGATLTQVFTRTRRAGVSLRDFTIAQMGNGATECEWRHAPEARRGFGEFWKSQLSWVLPRKKTAGFRLLTEARPVALRRVPLEMGVGRWKSQNRKNVYLTPYVEEPLNSKVIKSFVPELRSRVFLCFGIPMFCLYMLCTFRIFMYMAMVHSLTHFEDNIFKQTRAHFFYRQLNGFI